MRTNSVPAALGSAAVVRRCLASADHDGAINCMGLSEDGSLLVTGSDDHTARMWSTQTDDTECLGVLE